MNPLLHRLAVISIALTSRLISAVTSSHADATVHSSPRTNAIRRVPALVAVMALTLVGALANPLSAHAAAGVGAAFQPDQTVAAVPGVSTQNPDAAKRPTAPRSVAELAKGSAMTLRPQAAGKTQRMLDGAQVQDAVCTPYITGWISKTGLNVRIDYLTEVVCNFYLAGAGQAYLIERTSGSPYNGQAVAAAAPFSFYNGYYGYSYGAVLIDGRVYDGGARMEIGFNLTLQTLNGAAWAGCFALPNGQRYLSACAGVGTSTISVAVGSSEFSTGLAPNRLALLQSLTAPGPTSFTAWNTGRSVPSTYAAYEFDWSTNLCTGAPDNPLGFPFELPCARHDFGYRNYKAAQRFEANKERLDLTFYTDLQTTCAPYPADIRSVCLALAAIYYDVLRAIG